MIPLDKHDLTMLHVLSSERLMLKSLKAAKAGQELFPPRRVPHLDLLWRHFIRFAIQSKKEGHWLQWDRQAYVADCLEELKQRDDISDECKARFQAICVQYIGAEPLDAAAGDKLLLDAVNEAIRAQISRAVYNSEAFDGIRQLVNKGVALKESLETADEKQKLFVNPLLEVETYLHVLPKMPTGVRYFDRVTNGGMSEGEVALIAGLMGGRFGRFTPRGVSNKKVNCWNTLTGNAEGNQQPSLVSRDTRYKEGSSTIPEWEYPTSEGEALWLRNESMK